MTERTDRKKDRALAAARHNPLATVGIAFALGFALAVRGGEDEEDVRHPAVSRARNQIKGAIIGGVSAAISQQLRTFIEEQGGLGALLSAAGVDLPGGGPEDDDGHEPA